MQNFSFIWIAALDFLIWLWYQQLWPKVILNFFINPAPSHHQFCLRMDILSNLYLLSLFLCCFEQYLPCFLSPNKFPYIACEEQLWPKVIQNFFINPAHCRHYIGQVTPFLITILGQESFTAKITKMSHFAQSGIELGLCRECQLKNWTGPTYLGSKIMSRSLVRFL